MDALKKIKRIGWKYSVAILFNRIVPAWLFRTRRFVVYRMANPNEIASQLPDHENKRSVSISRCNSEPEIAAVEQLTYFSRSYSTGTPIAFAARLEDQLAAGMWAATECFDENELGVRVMLAPTQTWLFAALVEKEFRRLGLYSQLLPFAMKDMSEQGFHDQLVSVNPDNLKSDRIHQRLSKETIGHVLAARILRTTFCWTWGKITKEATFSWNSTNRPIAIRFDP